MQWIFSAIAVGHFVAVELFVVGIVLITLVVGGYLWHK